MFGISIASLLPKTSDGPVAERYGILGECLLSCKVTMCVPESIDMQEVYLNGYLGSRSNMRPLQQWNIRG